MRHCSPMRNVPRQKIWAISIAFPADNRGLNYDKYFKEGETERNTLTEFNSNNTESHGGRNQSQLRIWTTSRRS